MSGFKGAAFIALGILILASMSLVAVKNSFAHGKGGSQCNCMQQSDSGQGCGKAMGSGKGCGMGKHSGKTCGKRMHSQQGHGGKAASGRGCGKGKHDGHKGEMTHAGGCGKGKHAGKGCRMMPAEISAAEAQKSSAPGVNQFVQTCSQCHGLPDPQQHQAGDWSQVVERMLAKMSDSGMSMPDARDQSAILTYLQSGAR